MKRILYVLCTASLAMGLVGCGDSGGGYWPASPVAPAGGDQVQTLGNNSATTVTSALFSTTGGTAAALTTLSSALSGGCPMLPSLPSLNGGAPVFSKILAGSRSKSKTDTSFSNQAVVADNTGYNKFSHSYTSTFSLPKSSSSSSSSGGGTSQTCCDIVASTDSTSSTETVTYTASYTMYVKFMDSTGAIITLDTTKTDYWYYLTDGKTVDQVYFYGAMEFSTSGSTNYSWSDKTTFGSSTDPWYYKDLSKTTGVKVYGKTSTSSAGTFMGNKTEGLAYTFEIGGTDGYFLYSATSGVYPKGYFKMGNTGLFVTVTCDGTSTAKVSYSPSAPEGAATTIALY